MQILKLDHITLRTTRLDTMIEWYTNVLGLLKGHRPKSSFPGAWMYAGDTAVIHIFGLDGKPPIGSEADLKLEHFAFTATGRHHEFETKLEKMAVPFKRLEIASLNLMLINLWDPDGNHIHVDFELNE